MKPKALVRFQRSVVSWFRENARDLPWRKTSDPYLIWISEIMLQQTQVATVIPYYLKFVESFPTVSDLAKASEDEVLKRWEGLGYYRRARLLHAGAKFMVDSLNGVFPSSKEALLQIPGVGAYSAGAILSIAYRISTPALDGNLIRVYSRFFCILDEVNHKSVLKKLWNIASVYSATSPSDAREFAEGMMEIGALVCTPKKPQCQNCPLAWGCSARSKNLQNEIPRKERVVKRKKLSEKIWCYKRSNSLALLPKGADSKYPLFHRLPFRKLAKLHGRPDYRYSITDRDFLVRLETKVPRMKNLQWIAISDLDKVLLPSIDRRILRDRLNLTTSLKTLPGVFD